VKQRSTWRLVALVIFPLVVVSPVWAAVSDGVRWDWHFRESLVAIRDWETVLAAWEKGVPEGERTPVLPVPTDGSQVDWPNPIPEALIPSEDRELRVRARLVGGKAEVEGAQGGGKAAVAPGEVVAGYHHPGGGGKDRWYHAYFRLFDGLCAFRPQPAPFALSLGAPLDLRRGANQVAVGLRNATQRPLSLTVELIHQSPREQRSCGERTVLLAPSAADSARFVVDLDRPGGGLLILKVKAGGSSYWVPVLTHVEDVGAVLKSVEEILADAPDEEGAGQLAGLRRRAESASGGEWRSVFEEASALRDGLLLKRLPFDTLIFSKRKPFDSEQPFMDAHHLRNRPGGGIYRLSPVRPDGEVTPIVDSLGEGIYRDLCLSWDAHRLLFSFGNGNDQWDGGQSYHIYEVNVDGTGLRQLTFGTHNDCEPFHLPNGQIGFTSDRSERFVMCGGDRHAPNLFVMEGDGAGVRQLSFNMFNDFNPAVLPDGRIIYGRWEYNERSVTSLHNPFTINPDGTMMAPYYGNATIRPNVVMFTRPVPGTHKAMALFTAHHGQTHGPVAVIDQRRGVDGGESLRVLTPNVPTTGEHAEDSRYGWYSDPWPLSETLYLCSYTPTVVPWLERSWGVYVGDEHGDLALVYRDPTISCAEPVPLAPRPKPPAMVSATRDTDAQDAEAVLLLLDATIGLPGVEPGTAKYLRVVEDVPRVSVHHGGVVTTSGTSIYTIKRMLGTVPVEPDGSAYFTVPANRNVYFEVLDGEQCEIQRMRSVICLKPREHQTCIGCHEPRTTAPPNLTSLALRRPPSVPSPPPWGTATLSFLRDVQPVLNAECVGCHAFDRAANKVILTDDLTDQFTVAYQELLPYLAVANAMRWDNPDDVLARPPYTYGSRVSPLMKLLASGHHGVELGAEERLRLVNWIDANGVYYDTYETSHWPNRHIFSEATQKAVGDVYGRRCADCHGEDDGQQGTWWLSLSRRDATHSRMLQAPLAREVGGWGRCEGTVFANTSDADYQVLLGALTRLRDELAEHPREDLLSIRGTEVERQVVTLPPPPPSRPMEVEVLEGDWVYLSDLRWESAKAGWSPNGDLLPRLNHSIEGRPLTLGARRYRKGIGTHAPSEMVYELGGKYSRFFAMAGGAESGGTVTFQVFGDDRLLYQSPVMHGLVEVEKVDVSIAGVKRLRLVVTDAGDGYIADCANWAGARVQRAGR